MINTIIIGAGELGSRHLQGMLKCSVPMTVFVLDISEQALTTAKSRAAEIQHQHNVTFVNDLALIPGSFEIAIIASNANIRERLVIALLEKARVKFLVLEKVLFQELAAYDRVALLFKQTGQLAWVNHPRRMFSHYKAIKSQCDPEIPVATNYQCIGGNWGLGCNALHLIDLFSYLGDTSLESIDFSYLDEEVLESKRSGYVEFTGTINARLNNGSSIQLSSFAGDRSPLTVSIMSSPKRFIVQEGGTAQMIAMSKEDKYQMDIKPIDTVFQSSLTQHLVEDLLNKGTCDLPTYDEAAANHIIFITGLLEKYNSLTGLNTTVCPIT